MNPYDFVPIDPQHQPDRRGPIWHNVLNNADTYAGKLYSGYLHVDIKAETPLFIPNTNTAMFNPDYPYPDYAKEHICNNAEQYIIPGMSLKGMLRCVVEALCNGCLTVFDRPREYTHNPVPPDFQACQNNTSLCIACRLFGMMPREKGGAQVFLGKVNIGDALVYGDTISLHRSIYTAIMEAPKPRHQAFYLDPDKRYIAGRKFYFHHHGKLRTDDRLIPIRNKPGEFRNQYIQPLDTGVEFTARIDFTNLEVAEFAALLIAITLKPDMRHKIGYGKPIGLGSIHMSPTELRLVDYTKRYSALRSGGGIVRFGPDELAELLRDQMASFDTQINAAWRHFYTQPALDHLHPIWRWQPGSLTLYSYPSHDWFATHSQARIADTWNL